jgi:hypothetical protein
MATADSNMMETTTGTDGKTTTRRTERSAGTRFSTRQPAHRASRRLETRLFWA